MLLPSLLLALLPSAGLPPPSLAGAYDVGSPTITDLWVDPVNGSDAASGTSRGVALRTVTEAWNRVPRAATLTGKGYRLQLVAGTYAAADVPNFWEERYGTYAFPVIVNAADGPGTAVLPNLNFHDCRYLYLIGLRVVQAGGDVLQIAASDHVLLRKVEVIGLGDIVTFQSPQEALKINQCRYVYVEECDVSGAWDNPIDMVAVQYGHVIASRIHRGGDWCLYMKGGSAQMRVEANEIFDCGTGGFTAGQGTGFQFMTSPFIHYEAYDLKVMNNVVHDTIGAGLGANGGYDVLFAHNTLYRVGPASHGLEVTFGARSCDGVPGNPGREACATYLAAGGWGTTVVDDGTNYVRIPDRNVFFYGNVLLNPPGVASASQHFAIFGPYSGASQYGANVPVPTRADENLRIRGNAIWNGSAELPLGVEGSDAGCQPANLTCSEAQLRADNAIDTARPALADPERGDFRPVAGGNLFSVPAFAPPPFPGDDRPQPPLAPAGDLSNTVPADFTGSPRGGASPPGAFVSGAPAAPVPSGAVLMVPVVVATPGKNGAYFTSELVLTNKGAMPATLSLTYTDVAGPAGTVTDTLPPGRQKIVPDAVAYLRGLGLSLPTEGARVGTLRIGFSGLASPEDGAALVRTTTAVPGGRAGLAYAGVPPAALLRGTSWVTGLRQTSRDRSNLAMLNAGAASDGDVVLRVTVLSGDPAHPGQATLPDVTLPPGGFRQVNEVLPAAGLAATSGYARIERVSGSAPFLAYGVVNDEANGDGSFVPAFEEDSLATKSGFVVPVVVETGAFTSELVATNFSATRRLLQLTFVADALVSGTRAAPLAIELAPGEQRIVPELVDFLRSQGAPGVGPRGPTIAGALFVKALPGDARGVGVGVRTATPGGGGAYGLFYPGTVVSGGTAARAAWLFGLQQNGESRTNLAIVNGGEYGGDAAFSVELFDGETGALAATLPEIRLGARRWTQVTTVLAPYGLRNAYARVTRTEGTSPFLAYAVVNDGAAPGERSGDGAFIAMATSPPD